MCSASHRVFDKERSIGRKSIDSDLGHLVPGLALRARRFPISVRRRWVRHHGIEMDTQAVRNERPSAVRDRASIFSDVFQACPKVFTACSGLRPAGIALCFRS